MVIPSPDVYERRGVARSDSDAGAIEMRQQPQGVNDGDGDT